MGGMNSRKRKIDFNMQSVIEQLEKHILLSRQWSEEGLAEEMMELSDSCTIPLQTQQMRKKTVSLLGTYWKQSKTKQQGTNKKDVKLPVKALMTSGYD